MQTSWQKRHLVTSPPIVGGMMLSSKPSWSPWPQLANLQLLETLMGPRMHMDQRELSFGSSGGQDKSRRFWLKEQLQEECMIPTKLNESEQQRRYTLLRHYFSNYSEFERNFG